MTPADFTFFYIVEPPEYEVMACRLIASLRDCYGPEVRLIGYCPEHRMHEIAKPVIEAHRLMGAEIRPMRTEGMWDEDYPHGNKIIACLQEREGKAGAFVDSDVLFLKEVPLDGLAPGGKVSCSMAASMGWGGTEELWGRIYDTFGMELPSERLTMMRQKKHGKVVPYFSSGFVTFPEEPGPQGRFPEVWYDTARTLDRCDWLEMRRPYLDQMSLAPSIRRAGLDWNVIPQEWHYILGGRLRKKPLREDLDIRCIHYRKPKILDETGFRDHYRDLLLRFVGTKYLNRLTERPEKVRKVEPIPLPGKT